MVAPSSQEWIFTAMASDSAGGATSWVKETLSAGSSAAGPAYHVEIRFQASDIASKGNFTTASATSLAKGLSTGAKVAVGLGIPLIIVLLGIAIGVFLILKRRKLVMESDKTEKESVGAEVSNMVDDNTGRNSGPELRQELSE